ncbi:hypothetical protein G3N95_24145 [Paraburkholderia sp. Tr-20389]|uniref:hypothetical protein n=1 Tax=Paraburkholderia sp. Tr-20389 TaxID=2703903 RepID=UPI00198148D0|nr:hypothetical protein [Paraburkholderia sp. Tr-20389]MBN3756055.1 hypothetical protein [Paraburkholderia sp. Tr-20389]
MMRIALAAPIVVLLHACTSTDPGSAAGIDYHFPRTDVKVTLGVDVTQCDPKVEVELSLKADAVASADTTSRHRIDGAQLLSSVTKRGLTIDVDDNGVISSVNMTATDQGTVILGSAVKLISTVVGGVTLFDLNTGNVKFTCKTDTRSALQQLQHAKRELADVKQASLTSGKGQSAIDTQKKINALASMIASLKEALHRDLTATVDPKVVADKGTYDVPFGFKPLDELLDPEPMNNMAAILNDTDAQTEVAHSFGIEASLASPPASITDSTIAGNCDQSIWMPDAVPVTMKFTSSMKDRKVEKEVSVDLYASQLSPKGRPLCISAGFGENRVVGLKLDKFGRVTEFTWTSDARAANVAAAFAGAAPDATSAYKSIRDAGISKDKAELDKLTTEQALRKARQCQAILDAGGTSC